MTAIEFSKGHGTGNDFVILPDPENQLRLTPELVAALCDRRFGIGGDGVLRVVRTAADPTLSDHLGGTTAEWFMDYRNADGSVAELCGNGIRVFARYLRDRELVLDSELVVGTRSGPAAVVVTDEAVSATMGLPRVYGRSTARLGEREFTGLAVDCGNPHLVCPLPPGVSLASLELSAPPQVDPEFFPAGVNVEFTEVATGAAAGPAHIRMRVYERGVGETLSCGSGACAVAAATLFGGAAPPGPGEPATVAPPGVVTVDVPGGRLTVALSAEDCALTGPAVLVARGRVDLDRLAGTGWSG